MPIVRASPPAGDAWSHELKFDGFRCQVHRDGAAVRLLGRNGFDLPRAAPLASLLASLPVRQVVIDAELVALDDKGHPDFMALMRGTKDVVLYCFDILHLNGRDLADLPLRERRKRLSAFIDRVGHPRLRFSESFDDADALMAVVEKAGLEGIVSKRVDFPYISGRPASCWVKTKTQSWKAANRHRHQLFRQG